MGTRAGLGREIMGSLGFEESAVYFRKVLGE